MSFYNNPTSNANLQSILTNAAQQSANFTATANTNYTVNATSGNITVTLPTSTAGQEIVIKKNDSGANNVILSGTINGVASTTYNIIKQNQVKQLYADGSGGWNFIGGDLEPSTLIASPTNAGVVQLTGDLGGTSTAPTTPTAVHVTGAETIAGVKTFSSSPVVPTPTNTTDAGNKSYIDTAVATAVHLTGAETVAGIKTFSSSPIVPTPSGTTDVTNKSYVDTAVATAVHLTGAETVAGVKTFSSSPVVPTPSGTTDVTNKSYVDTAVAAITQGAATYITNNTGSSSSGYWTRFATVAISTAFADSAATLQFVNGGDSANAVDTVRVSFRVKQQPAFGTNPYVILGVEQLGLLTLANFMAVVTQNTPSSSTDLYVQIPYAYRNYNFFPIVIESPANITFYNSDSLVATLPAGQGQVAATRIGPPPITVGTTAPSSPSTGDIWIDTN